MISLEWQQLLTHTLGFLITLWVLKKFAWGPILGLLEERRQKIADEFANIDSEKEATETLKTEYENKLKNIEAERRQKIAEAANEANKLASDIKISAQEEARGIVNRTTEQLERDVASAKVQLKEDMVNITLNAAEKILHEKLDEAKERQLISGFIDGIEKA
ncbi:MAG: F0F1 ATP synthase subunit B [candidate division Zixibacteria bacterium]|nr:F0F1 ATP synthase subunit B [candidate division Zixibacteria bacterium]